MLTIKDEFVVCLPKRNAGGVGGNLEYWWREGDTGVGTLYV